MTYAELGLHWFPALGFRPAVVEWREAFATREGWNEHILVAPDANDIWQKTLLSVPLVHEPEPLTVAMPGSHVVPHVNAPLSGLSCACDWGFSGSHTQTLVVLSTGVDFAPDVPPIPVPAAGLLMLTALIALMTMKGLRG